MKIERIDLLHVRLKLKEPFETSSSRKDHLDHIVVKLYADGLIGYGESACPTEPFYCYETTQTCLHIQKDFIVPRLLGQDVSSVEDLIGRYRIIKGNNFAKSGIETAWWDLLARSEGKPLYKFLGGVRTAIDSGVSLGIEKSIEDLLLKIERFLKEGYRRVKLKIKPGKDLAIVKAVRQHFGDIPLMLDANSAYTLQDVPLFKELDPYNLMMIEQPLAHDDIYDHHKLQQQIKTPICLDESIHSVEDVRKAAELGSCQIINIKPGRIGGLYEARKIHDFCQQQGIPVWCGGMHEYGIGRAHNIAISTLPNFTLPGDISASSKYYHEDIVMPPIELQDGRISVIEAPGIGYRPVIEQIKKYTVASYEFKL
jgi:O-succinylbenzoate synthase